MEGPLAYVMAHLSFLDAQLAAHEGDLPEGRVTDLRRCLSEAMAGARRVRAIVSDLSPEEAPAAQAAVDLPALVLSCVKVLRTQGDPGARVETEFDAVPVISTNEGKLSRLVQNLLRDAATVAAAQPHGTRVIRLKICRDGASDVAIEVTVPGGTSASRLSSAEDPNPATRVRSAPLDLALCRHITEELGGSLVATHAGSTGSTSSVRVVLPRDPERRATAEAPFAPMLVAARRLTTP